MAVFRVERNNGYTVMSNHHLRNKELTLKAKGLLSQMLSLPENWDYTLRGLANINRESVDAIRTAVWELEKAGYIIRKQGRDEKGKLKAIEYIIYEEPHLPEKFNPMLDSPMLENPISDEPVLENPTTDNPLPENPMQLNKEIVNKELSNTKSIPIHSGKKIKKEIRVGNTGKGMEDAYTVYEEIIKDNIEYEHLVKNLRMSQERLDEIVTLILETACTSRKTIRIAGDDYPAELVKEKFMKLNSSHIQYAFEAMQKNTTQIRNIKQYLRAVLFNAPSTIGNYYAARVNHDLYGEEG